MAGPLSKILNYEYHVPADLIHAVPTGPVQGYELNSLSNNQSWEIVTHEGNFITIKNVSTGTYANPAHETLGAPVVGGHHAYKWQQNGVVGGWYQISTTDGKLAWLLTGKHNYAPIVLKPSEYKGKDAQWGYEPTKRVG